MTLEILRKIHCLDKNATIIPLVDFQFGVSLLPNDDLDMYHASAVLHPADSVSEIIVAKSIEAIMRFAQAHPAVKVDYTRSW